MHIALRITLAAVLASVAMTLAVAPASADQLAYSEDEYEIIWHRLTFLAGGDTTHCDVTFLGTFHETVIEKAEEALIGHITHAAINNCDAGSSGTVLAETLPWHVRWYEFAGELPNIESYTIGIIGSAFRVDPADLPACLAGTDAGEPGIGIAGVEEEGLITEIDADQGASIDLEGGFLCEIAGDMEFNGDGILTTLDGEKMSIILV